jgi:hypothetical protein
MRLPANLLVLLLAAMFGNAGCRAEPTPSKGPSLLVHESAGPTVKRTKLQLEFAGGTLTATLTDNETTRDFVSMLPITLDMDDLFGREKYGHLPRALASGGKRQHDYELGQVIYWSPGPDIAIYYKNDGERIPPPGIVVIGKVDAGIKRLDTPGSMKVTISLVEETGKSSTGDGSD